MWKQLWLDATALFRNTPSGNVKEILASTPKGFVTVRPLLNPHITVRCIARPGDNWR